MPPKDIYINVRVLKEMGTIMVDGRELDLKKNTQQLIRRNDAEQFIKHGIVEEVWKCKFIIELIYMVEADRLLKE